MSAAEGMTAEQVAQRLDAAEIEIRAALDLAPTFPGKGNPTAERELGKAIRDIAFLRRFEHPRPQRTISRLEEIARHVPEHAAAHLLVALGQLERLQ
jgi:hypothetical protein